MEKPKQRFSLRKLSIGTVSVLLGTAFYLGNMANVHADNATQSTSPKTPSISQNDASANLVSNKVVLHTQPSTDAQHQTTDEDQQPTNPTNQQGKQSTTNLIQPPTTTEESQTTKVQPNTNRGVPQRAY